MQCTEAEELISRDLDGELAAGDRPAFDAHLAGCAACQATAQALRLQDAAVRRAFEPRHAAAATVADRVIAEWNSPAQPVRSFKWLPVLAAAAAGFMVAALVFRPWSRPDRELAGVPRSDAPFASPEPARPGPASGTSKPAVPDSPLPAAQLVFAKGAIETSPQSVDDWRPLATGGTIEPGSRVRTDHSGRCEFRTPDGSEIRLNGNTELVFHSQRKLELTQGQVWSTVSEGEEPYEVDVPSAEARITALGTQFDVMTGLFAAVLTVVQGSTRVQGKADPTIVQFGEQAKIVEGRVAEQVRVRDLIVATSWVHEILVLKGHDNAELAQRMDDMLAQIGNAKMRFMYEKEILQLGDHCVLPLTRFIQSDRSREDRAVRVNAARILAKIARPWSVEDLIRLLADDDREVRYHAAKALERLTDGEAQGVTAEEWRDGDVSRRAAALERWNQWWVQHKDRFPTAPFGPAGPDRNEAPIHKS